jgi:hypothetical protein
MTNPTMDHFNNPSFSKDSNVGITNFDVTEEERGARQTNASREQEVERKTVVYCQSCQVPSPSDTG